MTSPSNNSKDLKIMINDTKQDMDDVYRALEKLRSLSQEERAESGMLRSRIDEQSNLICILKQRADEMLLRCQALEKINEELENLRRAVQKELDVEKKRSSTLEQRFMDLAKNHQELIKFKDEYKRQNAMLGEENARLLEENKALFCEEINEKEATIQSLTQELKELSEQHLQIQAEHKEKTAVFQNKLKELMNQHKLKEASLQHELQDTQEKLRNAVDMCTELDLKLKLSQDKHSEHTAKAQEKIEALTKEKEELLDLSMQRGKIIQEKQVEIEEMEKRCCEAEKARMQAEERFRRESASVDAHVRVRQLQVALDTAEQAYGDMRKDFEAFKSHSSDLLTKEKELNARLRHVTG